MTTAKRFLALFEGYEGAHGQTYVLDRHRHGKTQAKYEIVREPLTEELVQDHLDGKRGVGSIPINANNKCRFGALDIDDYNLDLAALYQKVQRLKLPLTTCRSKSGGAHLFLFLAEEVPAADVRDKLAEFASALGFGNCEIFPKQEEVHHDRGDVGNFINLPYFNVKYTTRYALDSDGESLDIELFLDSAESFRKTFKELRAFPKGTDTEVIPNGPPCLQQLTATGIPEGGRNNTLLNIGVYYRMFSPSDWKTLLEEHNQNYCNPPLAAKEIVTIQNQLDKKDYFYTCKQEPLRSHCNRSLCRTRKYGVGTGQQSAPILGGLTVVESEPPVWFVDADGARLELSTKQLQLQIEFQRACMEQMYRMPTRMKESDWRDLVDNLLDTATRIPVPEELTHKGQFLELVETFCTSRIRAHSPEELLTGKPWTDEGYTYFKLGALQDYLKRSGFVHYTRGQITERLKEMNANGAADKQYRFKDDKEAWRKVRVWFVPEVVKGDVELQPVVFEEEDIPF